MPDGHATVWAQRIRQSGRSHGPAQIGGGRAALRHALYEPIMTTIRCDPTFAAFYRRLRAKGKSVKQARIGCLRRFLGVLNAMVRDGLSWAETEVAVIHRLQPLRHDGQCGAHARESDKAGKHVGDNQPEVMD